MAKLELRNEIIVAITAAGHPLTCEELQGVVKFDSAKQAANLITNMQRDGQLMTYGKLPRAKGFPLKMFGPDKDFKKWSEAAVARTMAADAELGGGEPTKAVKPRRVLKKKKSKSSKTKAPARKSNPRKKLETPARPREIRWALTEEGELVLIGAQVFIAASEVKPLAAFLRKIEALI